MIFSSSFPADWSFSPVLYSFFSRVLSAPRCIVAPSRLLNERAK